MPSVKWTHEMINKKIQEALMPSVNQSVSPMDRLKGAVQAMRGNLRGQSQANLVEPPKAE